MPRVLIADKLSPAAIDIFKHRGVDGDVVLRTASVTPDDEADRALRLAVDENLSRCDNNRVGDRRICDGDTRDVEVNR